MYVLTMAIHFPQSFQADFFRRNPLAESLIRALDALPQIYFYVKDEQSRFVKVNRLFLENHGLDDETEALGKTDFDFHPPVLAEAYVSEERRCSTSQTCPGSGSRLAITRRSSLT